MACAALKQTDARLGTRPPPQPRPPLPTPPRPPPATNSNPTSSPPTSTTPTDTKAKAAGAGTPAPPPGSTSSTSNTSLGIRIQADTLSFTPLFPPDWTQFKLTYRYRNTFYHVELQKTGPDTTRTQHLWLDGIEQPDGKIHLLDDGRERHATVHLG
jgi:hypothetical protein